MRYLSICAFLFLIVSSSLEAQWVAIGSPPAGTNTWAVQGTDFYSVSNQVYLSTNLGGAWTSVSPPLPASLSPTYLLQEGTSLFVFEYCHDRYCRGLFRCELNGSVWTSMGMGGKSITGAIFVGTNLYVGTTDGIYVSTDRGSTFNSFAFKGQNAFLFGSDGKHLIAGCWVLNVFQGYRSSDDGQTWEWMTKPPLCISNGQVYARQFDNALYSSTDGGTYWTSLGNVPTGTVLDVLKYGSNTFASGTTGVFLLKSNGWLSVRANLGSQSCYLVGVFGPYLVVSTGLVGGGFVPTYWRRPLSEMVTSVDGAMRETPDVNQLSQNYPNPFNPSTTIRYGLPSRAHVTLAVFNTLGQQVSILQNGEQDAGYHEVKFDAQHLPSGVYFYRMQAGTYTETKRLLLLK